MILQDLSGSPCMKPSVIVWDLETVPDLSGFAAANDLVGKSDVEVPQGRWFCWPMLLF
jgi:hypothetical protein